MKQGLEKFITENREAFDDRVPNPDVFSRIQQRIAQPAQEPAKKGIVISFTAIRWVAAACVVVLAGIGIWWMNSDNSNQQTLAGLTPNKQEVKKEIPNDREIIEKEPAVITGTTDKEPTTAFVTAKVDQRKEMLFASLNNMESASTRIAAAMKAYEMKNADKDIVDALFHSMNNDPNTNVRLAALEAIARFHRESYVRKKLTASLKIQKDPVVQVELIQILTKMKQTSILSELEKMVKDVNTTEAVKDRAYSSILTLGS